MKKCLTLLLAVLVLASALAGRAEPLREADIAKLLALRFDGYEEMTVAEYQRRVWALTDTPAYRSLLERCSKDEALYQMRDSDETAAFLFYILEPLTAERWQTRDYSGSAATDFPAPEENATLEYTFTLTILNADALTVKDYNDARLGVTDAMDDLLAGRTKADLRDKTAMLADIQADVDDLIRSLRTTALGVAIDYAYFPLSDEADGRGRYDGDGERRDFPNGTEADYRSLLALKTPEFPDMILADFNRSLLAWADEDYGRMERIGTDTAWNDFQVDLTAEELSFVKLTTFLSGMENGKFVQSSYTGQDAADPAYGETLPQKTIEDAEKAAWCSLYYQFSYHIADAEAVTVGERDRQIGGMIHAVRAFWNDADAESLLKMSESDVVEMLESIAAAYSTDSITIAIHEDQVHFERMDERPFAN